MKARHVVALPARPGDAACAWEVDAALQPVGPVSRGPLEDVVPDGRHALVLVPTEEVLLLPRVALPPARSTRLEQALPFAVENWIAGDVEAQHVAWVRRRGSDPTLAVAVVTRARMQGWLSALEAAGMRADALLADALALPWEAGAWTVLVDGPRALVRTGRHDGFATSADTLVSWLRAALADAEDPPQRLRLLDLQGARTDSSLCAGNVPGGMRLEHLAPPAEGLAGAMTGILPDAGPDLLQGAFRRTPVRASRGAVPWKLAAVLLLAWVSLHSTRLAWESAALRARADETSVRTLRLFQETFPEVKRVVDVRTQAAQRLDALRAGADRGDQGFLPLLAGIAGPLAGSGVALQGLRYEDRRLVVDVEAASVSDFDLLREATQAQVVDVRTSAGEAGERVVTGRLRLGDER